MDVEQFEITDGQSLPNNDRIYRHGPMDWIDTKDQKFIPTLKFFDLSEPDKLSGYHLSVDWENRTTPEETIIRIGCSFSINTTKFKNYKNRVIFALDVRFLVELNGILKVSYSPIIQLIEKTGHINNLAHSLISFDKEEFTAQLRPAVITEMRNHAKDKKINFDMEVVDKAVLQYRDQSTDTN